MFFQRSVAMKETFQDFVFCHGQSKKYVSKKYVDSGAARGNTVNVPLPKLKKIVVEK